MRAGLAARTSTELLRGSAIRVVRNDVSAAFTTGIASGDPGMLDMPEMAGPPDAPELPPSISRCSIGTMSAASAYLSWMISTSDAFGTSSDAMTRASRRMLSA